MSCNIGITTQFLWSTKNKLLKQKALIPFFEIIQGIDFSLKIFAINWWSLQPDGTAEVFDVSAKKVVKCSIDKTFDLIHIFKLGYPPVKSTPFSEKWTNFESKLKIIEKANIPCINPVQTLRYFINKEYLLYLQRQGVRVISTKKVSSLLSYQQLIAECGDFYKIIKPINGECGKLVRHINEISPTNLNEYAKNSCSLLLQPYVSEIEQGEISIIYIGSKFSHAVIKKPSEGSFKCNGPHVGATINPYNPSAEEIRIGLTIRDIFQYKLEIFRFDYVITSTGPLIMEVEVLDPNYYTKLDPFCAEKLYNFYITYLK